MTADEEVSNSSAVGLLHDIITSQHTRTAVQELFGALAADPKTAGQSIVDGLASQEKWIDALAKLEGKDARVAKLALLKLILFLEAARDGDEAEEFFRALLEIGGFGTNESAHALVEALRDETVHSALGRLANSLGAAESDKPIEKEQLAKDFDDVVEALKKQQGIISAAVEVHGAMQPLNSEGSMVSEMLQRVEKHVQESGEDLIGQLTKDPMNFASTMIRAIVWPVLSKRLSRIEVPDVKELKSKDTYVIDNIVVRVVELPERLQLLMQSTMDLVIDEDSLTNGGSQMVITIVARGIGAVTDPIHFVYDKKSFPSFSDAGHLDVTILKPGLDLSVAMRVMQPPGPDSCPIFDAGDFKTHFNTFQVQFHKDVRNERLLNTVSRWFAGMLSAAIASAVSAQLQGILREAFALFTRLLQAQQALAKKVEQLEQAKLRRKMIEVPQENGKAADAAT
eukprot:comp22756_c0_seq1/m.35529 comp22756_c0_seq1/g.35529  ORF comp22756_c0_seq1/g.35529 comp22756_c0_seq1/m.35529 type:complete len:454 (-) comp22756_c0_seq1:198-1559(-)